MTVTRLTDAATTLLASPPLSRLTEHLRDLIIVALERSTNTRGNSYRLVRLEYVSGENLDDRSCMHFDAQVKELDRNANVRLQVYITVKTGDEL